MVTDSDRRGAQVFAAELGEYLAKCGVTIETVALRPGSSSEVIDARLLSNGERRVPPLGLLHRLISDADVVIAHGSRTLMATALASSKTRTPVIYRQISDLSFWAGTVPRRLRVQFYLTRMSHVVTLWPGSERVLTSQFRVPTERISVIPNGANPAVFSPANPADKLRARARFGVEPDEPLILYVGALAPEKGVDLAIEALELIDRARLLIVGHGGYADSLRRLAEEICPGRVTFAGAVSNMQEAYAAADALVLPSRTEQMPAVIIEAGMCGVASVSTRVGAVPSMLVDGVTGFLTDPSPYAIAESLRVVLVRPELGQAARAHFISSYSMEKVGCSWLSLIEKHLGGASGRSLLRPRR